MDIGRDLNEVFADVDLEQFGYSGLEELDEAALGPEPELFRERMSNVPVPLELKRTLAKLREITGIVVPDPDDTTKSKDSCYLIGDNAIHNTVVRDTLRGCPGTASVWNNLACAHAWAKDFPLAVQALGSAVDPLTPGGDAQVKAVWIEGEQKKTTTAKAREIAIQNLPTVRTAMGLYELLGDV